ncbi:Rid family detoxifying hydrolase [Eisenibacter elegans]|uniref:Rid family detoxifying hydrolase n=1 Tax=Eisenibacter elegans TaxID=997 RepID=UPI000428239E|nr:Rid family detoxifying hydrolase [Eisenibacter elegans]
MAHTIVNSAQAPTPVGPYNHAVLAQGVLYVSGQIALDTAGNFHNQDIRTETTQVMRNLAAILEAAGMNWSNVVKCSIFLRDLNDYVAVNEVYGSFFTEQAPAREAMQVVRLPKDANVEISCIAVQS